jgi:hypothetical protein
MDHFAGLDVAVKETSVCIVDDTGKIVREVKVLPRAASFLIAFEEPSLRQFDRCRWTLDTVKSWSSATCATGSPAARRRSISGRLRWWHVLQLLITESLTAMAY